MILSALPLLDVMDSVCVHNLSGWCVWRASSDKRRFFRSGSALKPYLFWRLLCLVLLSCIISSKDKKFIKVSSVTNDGSLFKIRWKNLNLQTSLLVCKVGFYENKTKSLILIRKIKYSFFLHCLSTFKSCSNRFFTLFLLCDKPW